MIVIFDWDGTLCNSIDHIIGALEEAARELAVIPPSARDIRQTVGLGLPQALAELFPTLAAAHRSEIALAYSRHFADPARGPAVLFEGALDTLETLRARGIELAVATGKSRKGLDRVLATLGLADFFEVTRCADETRSKPHPMMLHEILHDRGKPASAALMVGDSEYDLAMARGAGVSSVAVSFGAHGCDRLAAHQPLAIIDKLAELLDLEVLSG